MKCGFYEAEITPNLGSIIPGGFAARYSVEVQERLFVRAFAAITDERSLAVIVADACGITLDITERIRARVAENTEIRPEDVLVMATHCHGGGPTLNWGEEVVTDPVYIDFLVCRAADAAILSYRRAVESELVKGKEELYGVSFVRDYLMKDGSYKTNPSYKTPELIEKPYTTIDPEVLVLGVKQEGKWVGAIVNFANHPAIVDCDKISSDFIAVLSDEMKEKYGKDFVTLFVNGACGNINHLNPFDPETRAKGRHIVVGKALAEKASLAMENGEVMKNETLASAKKTIQVALRKPTPEALLAAKEVFDSYGDDLVNRVPRTPEYRKVFYALQAFRAMADKRTQQGLELQLFQIGDCYLAGTPNQIYVEFGKSIKKGIPGPCFVSAFSNDYRGYVPVADFIGKPGIYEARLCPTSALEPAAGDKIVEGVLSLLPELK